MAKKKEILQRTPDFAISIFDILSKIDVSKTNKFVDLMSRCYNKTIDNIRDLDNHISYSDGSVYSFEANYIDSKLSGFEREILDILMRKIQADTYNDRHKLVKFMRLVESKSLPDNNIDNYKSFGDIASAVDNYLNSKVIVNDWEYRKFYEDDEYLIVMPFTHNASLKYGAGTRWCTASTDNAPLFYEYMNTNVLVYIINKQTNYKVAANKNCDSDIHNVGFWDSEDRRVDTYFTKLPKSILDVVITIIKDETRIRNLDYLSTEDLKLFRKMIEDNNRVKDEYNLDMQQPSVE